MNNEKIRDLMEECFFCGVDCGQLSMEEERFTDECLDAGLGHIADKKYCMPIPPRERRQLHSDKWFEVKRKGKKKFFRLLKQV